MIDDLKNYKAPVDAFQFIDSVIAGISFVALLLLAFIFLRVW